MPLRKIFSFLIAAVWFANGFLCKLLNLVPRHQQIVSEILGSNMAAFATKAIGVSEVLMAVWVLSGYRPRFCAIFQVVIIMTMNTLEFALVPQLLLFGRMNIVFAGLFCCLILYNEYYSPERSKSIK